MRPRIGITGPDRGGLAAWLFTWLAVRRAGGIPVRITPSRPRPGIPMDGLIIGGGADIDPALYGEHHAPPPLRELRRRSRTLAGFLLSLLFFPLIWVLRRLLSTKRRDRGDAGRDQLETRLLHDGLAAGMPVLGICRGAQLLNVVCGGSLYQDLTEFYTEAPDLYTIWPQKSVDIVPDSRLALILGRRRCHVNSLHRQAIRECGRDLRVAARDTGTVIQAIEHGGREFVLGVQWHPEYLPQKAEQQALFRALVDTAARLDTEN